LVRSVGYRESAVVEFQTLPKAEQRRLRDALQRIADSFPKTPSHLDVERIRGTETLWRLAFGEYRCVFRLEEDRLVVFAVGARTGFYQRFGVS
jgi:mRNA-degrading endonuclease RelE of RelBE toxin-antitoxin system